MGRRNWSVGQGQGDSTPGKEEAFAAIFRAFLAERSPAGRPYHHLDLNCGSGYNRVARCMGSPMVFLRAAVESGYPGPVHAYFCDIDPAAVTDLRGWSLAWVRRLHEGSAHFKACDNAEFLPGVAGGIAEEESPAEVVGSCLCDANGWRVGFPVKELSAFFAAFPGVDFVLNLNLSLLAMVRGCKASCRESIAKGFRDWPELPDLLARFHKRNWFIRNPSSGGMRFTILVGRNGPGDLPVANFWPLDSSQGREIVASLGGVQPGQGFLFGEW